MTPDTSWQAVVAAIFMAVGLCLAAFAGGFGAAEAGEGEGEDET